MGEKSVNRCFIHLFLFLFFPFKALPSSSGITCSALRLFEQLIGVRRFIDTPWDIVGIQAKLELKYIKTEEFNKI